MKNQQSYLSCLAMLKTEGHSFLKEENNFPDNNGFEATSLAPQKIQTKKPLYKLLNFCPDHISDHLKTGPGDL